MAFNEGFQQGKSVGVNPWASAISRVNESMARREAEAQKQREEARELAGLFTQLGKKHEYDMALEKERVKNQGSLIEKQGAESRKTSLEESIMSGDVIPDEASGILDASGVKRYKTNPEGPSAKKKMKSDLDLEKAQYEASLRTPEGKANKLREGVEEEQVKDLAKMVEKVKEAKKAVEQLRVQYNRGDKPESVKRGNIFGGIKERGKGIFQGIEANLGANAELKTYINNRKGFASLISKSGFMESGVLTQFDIDRMLSILPTSMSTKEEADAAWREIGERLSSAEVELQQKLGGGDEFDVKNMSEEQLRKIAGGR